MLYIVLTLQLPRCCLTPPRACSSSRVHDIPIYTVSHRKSIIYVQYTYKLQTFTNDYVCRNILVCSFSLSLLATGTRTFSEIRLITIACALIDIARLSLDTFHGTSSRNRAFDHVASGIYTRKLRRTMIFVLLVRLDSSSRRRKRAK